MEFPKVIETKIIPIDKIMVSKYHPRQHNIYKDLEKLAESIEIVGGLMQPILVFQKGEEFELVVGQRRFFAVRKILKMDKILATIIEKPEDEEEFVQVVNHHEGFFDLRMSNHDLYEILRNLYKKYYSVTKVQRMLGLSKKEIDKYVGPWCFREEVVSEIGNKEFSIDEAMMALQALGGDVDSVDVEDWIEIAKELHKLRNKGGVVYDKKLVTFVSKKPQNYIIKYDALSNEERKRIEEFAEKNAISFDEAFLQLVSEKLEEWDDYDTKK
tara:strand:- start:4201 stop:5010 length:810 start_codon:yes stop_codon:yes gene_type:complete